MATPYTFRRRKIGRTASLPTWACYEQIHGDEASFSESGGAETRRRGRCGGRYGSRRCGRGGRGGLRHGCRCGGDGRTHPATGEGEQRAVDPVPPPPKCRTHSNKQKQPHWGREYTLRPILTIQRSQGFGFVWNQDLFNPPYIKDRYVASTSPRNGGFISTSVSCTNSALTEYDSVEVVEIRV
ncbi:hypothetical protein K438DRAFT_1733338 [Mycena galopus ATCC 62051]|nr:hypothetical protein K438DRAFT_1733338 [Mycena galopus ATCC 62051]